MKTKVYIESKKSLAFDFLDFKDEKSANLFCKKLMQSCHTLNAKIAHFNIKQ